MGERASTKNWAVWTLASAGLVVTCGLAVSVWRGLHMPPERFCSFAIEPPVSLEIRDGSGAKRTWEPSAEDLKLWEQTCFRLDPKRSTGGTFGYIVNIETENLHYQVLTDGYVVYLGVYGDPEYGYGWITKPPAGGEEVGMYTVETPAGWSSLEAPPDLLRFLRVPSPSAGGAE